VHFGEQLSALTHAKANSTESRLQINGLDVRRINAVTPFGVNETLNRLQYFCTDHGGLTAPDALLQSAPVKSIRSQTAALGGTYRHETEHAGVLACIDTQRPLGLAELTARLQAFVKTGNLSTIGSLRYVLARREKSVTSMLVLWTEGDALLLQMFPKSGDTPGRDVPDFPRPEHARRVFSATEDGARYSLTTYQLSATSPASAVEWYKAQLPQHGWRVTGSKRPSILIAQRGPRLVVISSTTMGAGSISTTIAEL
jgi:hypothetical protein